MVCAIETTHDFHAVVPVILVCVIADAIAVRYMPHSIMTEKIARRGVRVVSDYVADYLEQVLVGDVAAAPVVTLRADDSTESVVAIPSS